MPDWPPLEVINEHPALFYMESLPQPSNHFGFMHLSMLILGKEKSGQEQKFDIHWVSRGGGFASGSLKNATFPWVYPPPSPWGVTLTGVYTVHA